MKFHTIPEAVVKFPTNTSPCTSWYIDARLWMFRLDHLLGPLLVASYSGHNCGSGSAVAACDLRTARQAHSVISSQDNLNFFPDKPPTHRRRCHNPAGIMEWLSEPFPAWSPAAGQAV